MLRVSNQTPDRVVVFRAPVDSPHIDREDVELIAEIFQTPLTGAYSWDYCEADKKLRKLYRLGKERNWNVDIDLDWSQVYPRTKTPMILENPYATWEPYRALDDAAKLEFEWHCHAWALSQFLHGEQGALLVASQLVSCAPTHDAKAYAASQTFDEARHVEVFSRYLRHQAGVMYPVNRHLKALLDKILTDPRWDLKFIGMQMVIESLALAAFHVQKAVAAEPLLRQLLEFVTRDEARHVSFGVTYLEQFVKTLSAAEIEERAQFAFEACRVMRERIVPTDVFEHYGFDVEEGRRRFLAAGPTETFRSLLFMRIMPNLARVGLLTDAVKSHYEALGLMQFAGLPSDGDIDWAELAKPLPSSAADVGSEVRDEA